MPKHPEYATLAQRLNTFAMWPPSLTQTPLQVSMAGFYYTGMKSASLLFTGKKIMAGIETEGENILISFGAGTFNYLLYNYLHGISCSCFIILINCPVVLVNK